MAIIYGVDTGNPVAPLMVRDAIIRCFIAAHSKQLEGVRTFRKFDSDGDFENFKLQYIDVFIRGIFCKAGFCGGNGSYSNPTKESLMKVVEALKEYASEFRSQDVIEQHASEIMTLINLLS
ncbi:MAG: hypothetical protein NTZ73_00065 [Candidatus Diapherotrites archaeon]|nr:hypothetical protein [Candidatus Diapherotrites archaeon]